MLCSASLATCKSQTPIGSSLETPFPLQPLTRHLRKSRLRAFTLIELMIVTSIIGIQAAIAMPAFIKYLRESRTAEVGTNLKTIGDGAMATDPNEIWEERRGGLAYRSLPHDFLSLTSVNTPDGQLTPGGNWDVCSERLDYNRTVWESLDFRLVKPVYYRYDYCCAPLDGVSQQDPTTGEVYTTIDGQTPNSTGVGGLKIAQSLLYS